MFSLLLIYFCVYMLLYVLVCVQGKLFKQITPGTINKVVWIGIEGDYNTGVKLGAQTFMPETKNGMI